MENETVFFAMIVLRAFIVPELLSMPPAVVAELTAIVLLVRLVVPLSWRIPPPHVEVLFCATVLVCTFRMPPELWRPPPHKAKLPVIVLDDTPAVPLLDSPPPLTAAFPAAV